MKVLRIRLVHAAAAVLALACVAGPSGAQQPPPTADDKEYARGIELVKQGQIADAVAVFEKLKPAHPNGLNLFLALADAYDRQGRTADAWSQYTEAQMVAQAAHDAPHEKKASLGLEALKGKLARLTVVVPDESRAPGLVVLRQGAEIAPALWAAAVPVNPQKTVIEAKAGDRSWSTSREIHAGDQVVVVIPDFTHGEQPASSTVAPVVTGAATATAATATLPTAAPGLLSSPLRVASAVSGGVGLAGLLTASILSGVALVRRDASSQHCARTGTQDTVVCDDPASVDLRRQAGDLAHAATAVWAIGGAATAAAIVLWMVGEPAPAKTGGPGARPFAGASPQGGFLGLEGSF